MHTPLLQHELLCIDVWRRGPPFSYKTFAYMYILSCGNTELKTVVLRSFLSFFSFGLVYYSTVSTLNLWSNGEKKSTFLAVKQPGFYLHSAIKAIWHKLLSTMDQMREQICLKTSPAKSRIFGFQLNEATWSIWLHTTLPAASARGWQERSWGQEWGLLLSICQQPSLILRALLMGP